MKKYVKAGWLSFLYFCLLPGFINANPGSCRLDNAGICIHYDVGYDHIKAEESCLNSQGNYLQFICKDVEFSGSCYVSRNSESARVYFYKSGFNQTEARQKCENMNGEYNAN